MLFYILQRKYLRRMQTGGLTCQQVSDKLKLPVSVVEKEYEDYINPFSSKKLERRNANIQLIVSILSTLLVLLTLFEMQKARNAAYQPDVCISFATENNGIELTWDENGILTQSSLATFSLPIEMRNIGVGTAKDINFYWNWDENVEKYENIINQSSDIKVSHNDSQLFIEKNGITDAWGNYRNSSLHFEFINNTDTIEKMWFPDVYYVIATEAIRLCGIKQLPYFDLRITYKDIQGKQYEKYYYISPRVLHWSSSPNGETICRFDLAANEFKIRNVFSVNPYYFIVFSIMLAIIVAQLAYIIALRNTNKNRHIQKELNGNTEATTDDKKASSS